MTITRRHGFSLIELLVVIAIVGILVGLFLAAVQKARGAAARTQCQNNLHQILLAAQSAHDSLGYLPGNSSTSGKAIGTTFYCLLPFIEQQAVHDTHAYGTVIKVYHCPGDPSDSAGNNAPGNYATNDLVFRPATQVMLPRCVPDGTSNTIFFAEKYGVCSSWASVVDGSPIGCFKPAYTATKTPPGPSYPFQVTPAVSRCDCAVPQSPHTGGIQVGMGDGSVRLVSSQVSNAVWYAANDPADGQGLED
jgi:prepilin-type N-terminal cleavage/methylation domain-containing protein